jgi:hypothetical protein
LNVEIASWSTFFMLAQLVTDVFQQTNQTIYRELFAYIRADRNHILELIDLIRYAAGTDPFLFQCAVIIFRRSRCRIPNAAARAVFSELLDLPDLDLRPPFILKFIGIFNVNTSRDSGLFQALWGILTFISDEIESFDDFFETYVETPCDKDALSLASERHGKITLLFSQWPAMGHLFRQRVFEMPQLDLPQ